MIRNDAIRNIVEWAARECERQQVGPERVARMVDAALWLEEEAPVTRYNHRIIQTLGEMVESDWNKTGRYRIQKVTIGGIIKLPPPEQVDRLMNQLLDSHLNEIIVPHTVADEFYRQFEEIHPFADGNGRVGSILWNYMLGNLIWPYDHLEDPPNLWKTPGTSTHYTPAWYPYNP